MALRPDLARIAENLLMKVPKQELKEFIDALNYFNATFQEQDRAKAIRNGSNDPSTRSYEESIRKSLGQEMYLVSPQVCPCCLR